MSDETDPLQPWVKTRSGTVYFGLITVDGFEADDGTLIPRHDIVDSSESPLRDS